MKPYTLNFPPSNVSIKAGNEGKPMILDPLRNKWVTLTPEEWVRQHFCGWLVTHRNYPRSFMANEVTIKFNGMTRRCDTVVYDKTLRPIMIVEYKAPDVEICQKTFDQIVRYNMVLHARCIVVTNGLKHFCCRTDQSGNYSFIPEIPPYENI